MTRDDMERYQASLHRMCLQHTVDAFGEALRVAWAVQKRGGTVDELVQLLDDRFRVAFDQSWDVTWPEEVETMQ